MRAAGSRLAADMMLLAKVAIGAIAGGFLSMALLVLLYAEINTRLLLVFVGTVVVLSVLTVGIVLSESAPRAGSARPRGPWAPSWPGPQHSSWDKHAPPTPAEWGAADLVPPDGHGGWPNPANGQIPTFPGPTRPSPPLPKGRPPPVVEHAVPGADARGIRVRRIVQCPRCGDFAVDVRRGAARFHLDCRRCRHSWEWKPDHPWPATIVRPGLSGSQPTPRNADTGQNHDT